MVKLNNKIKLTTLITVVLLLVLLTFGLVNLGVNWSSNGLGDSLTEGFKNLFGMFDFSKWSTITANTAVAYTLAMLILLVGTLLSITWIALAIIRKDRKFGILGGTSALIFTLVSSFFVANLNQDFSTSLTNGDVTAYFVYVMIVLALVVLLYLFTLSLIHVLTPLHSENAKQAIGEEVFEKTITIVETEEPVQTPTTVIINNNYYVKEKSTPNKTTVVVNETNNVTTQTETVEVAFASELKRRPRTPFALKLQQSEQNIRDIYDELKAELFSYGLKSRISIAGDTFRLHTVTYAQIQISGKNIKVYFALDPKDFVGSTYPIADVSSQKIFSDTPVCLKVKSGLSIRRAKELIESVCEKNGVIQEEIPQVLDYSREAIATLNDSEYYLKNFAE